MEYISSNTGLQLQLTQEIEERARGIGEVNQSLQTVKTFLDETRGVADSNTNRLNNHDSEFGNTNNRITNNENRINNNENGIRSLTESLRESSLAFHVETTYVGVYPQENVIGYGKKLVDTFNVLDAGSGTFSAPFSGSYGFFFYSEFSCSGGSNYLYYFYNDQKVKVYECQIPDDTVNVSETIYFALSLRQGETVRMFSGSANLYLYSSPASFMGFLLQKE
jgi:hypothetical protein